MQHFPVWRIEQDRAIIYITQFKSPLLLAIFNSANTVDDAQKSKDGTIHSV